MQQIIVINENTEWKIRQVTKEVLNPLKTNQKLSKSEQIKLAASAKTDHDNLKLIQKQAENNKNRDF